MLKDSVSTSIFLFNCYLCLGTLHVRVQWILRSGNRHKCPPHRLELHGIVHRGTPIVETSPVGRLHVRTGEVAVTPTLTPTLSQRARELQGINP